MPQVPLPAPSDARADTPGIGQSGLDGWRPKISKCGFVVYSIIAIASGFTTPNSGLVAGPIMLVAAFGPLIFGSRGQRYIAVPLIALGLLYIYGGYKYQQAIREKAIRASAAAAARR